MTHPSSIMVEAGSTTAKSKDVVNVRPTHFSSSEKIQFLELDEAHLTLRYVGKGQHHHDVGNDVDVAFFEIQLLKFEPGTKLAVGLVTEHFVLDDLPGSQAKSYGITAGGEFWVNGRRKSPELPAWKSNSVVGCGLNFLTNQLFFTLDGVIIKTEENVVGGKWFPCVGLHGHGQCIRANFGRFPFCYDIEGKRAELMALQVSQIDDVRINSLSRIIYNYLLFNAYKETANALSQSNPTDLEPLTERDSIMLGTLELRATIREMLTDGRSDEAKQILIGHFGDVASTSEAIFVLDCQSFVELVKQKRFLEAIEFSQVYFLQWWGEATYQRIEECCSLLAYFEPTQAPAAYLLTEEHVTQTFELVNRSILEWSGVFNVSATGAETNSMGKHSFEDEPDLVTLIAHLAKTHNAIRNHRGAGIPFDLNVYTLPTQEVSSSVDSLRASKTPVKRT